MCLVKGGISYLFIMTTIEEGAILICSAIQNALQTNSGLLIGRLGTVEYECVASPTASAPWSVLERNAGVFPTPASTWCKAYKEALQKADCLATGWYAPMASGEQHLLRSLGWSGHQVKLRSLEAYYVEASDRWTKLLEDQDVCVVSSFAETMAKQVKKGNHIWGSLQTASLLPSSTRWSFVRTGYAPSLAQGRATWLEATGEEINSWEEAVEATVKQILATKARIILIGCGGLGMILASRLKQEGRICIMMGGAIQVLFGVKGMRWRHHEVISKFWNSEWVWPSVEETPAGSETVEGSCYWLR